MRPTRLLGGVAHRIHRFTGLALLVYLFLHVRTIHSLSEGPEAFDRAVAAFRHPLFKLGEIALLGAVILHAVNGIRVMLADYGVSGPRGPMRWAIAIAALLFAAGATPMFLFSVMRLRG